MRRFLRLSPEAAPIHRVHPLGSLHLALVDTCVPGQMHGHLDDEALDLVESSLAPLSQDARALLVMHHPLRLLGHGFVDTVLAFGETARLERRSAPERIHRRPRGRHRQRGATGLPGAPHQRGRPRELRAHGGHGGRRAGRDL